MNKFKSVVLLSFLYVGSQGAFSSGLPPLLPPVDPLQSATDQRLEMINRCKDYFGSPSGRSDVLAAWSQELDKLREHAIEKRNRLEIIAGQVSSTLPPPPPNMVMEQNLAIQKQSAQVDQQFGIKPGALNNPVTVKVVGEINTNIQKVDAALRTGQLRQLQGQVAQNKLTAETNMNRQIDFHPQTRDVSSQKVVPDHNARAAMQFTVPSGVNMVMEQNLAIQNQPAPGVIIHNVTVAKPNSVDDKVTSRAVLKLKDNYSALIKYNSNSHETKQFEKEINAIEASATDLESRLSQEASVLSEFNTLRFKINELSKKLTNAVRDAIRNNKVASKAILQEIELNLSGLDADNLRLRLYDIEMAKEFQAEIKQEKLKLAILNKRRGTIKDLLTTLKGELEELKTRLNTAIADAQTPDFALCGQKFHIDRESGNFLCNGQFLTNEILYRFTNNHFLPAINETIQIDQAAGNSQAGLVGRAIAYAYEGCRDRLKKEIEEMREMPGKTDEEFETMNDKCDALYERFENSRVQIYVLEDLELQKEINEDLNEIAKDLRDLSLETFSQWEARLEKCDKKLLEIKQQIDSAQKIKPVEVLARSGININLNELPQLDATEAAVVGYYEGDKLGGRGGPLNRESVKTIFIQGDEARIPEFKKWVIEPIEQTARYCEKVGDHHTREICDDLAKACKEYSEDISKEIEQAFSSETTVKIERRLLFVADDLRQKKISDDFELVKKMAEVGKRKLVDATSYKARLKEIVTQLGGTKMKPSDEVLAGWGFVIGPSNRTYKGLSLDTNDSDKLFPCENVLDKLFPGGNVLDKLEKLIKLISNLEMAARYKGMVEKDPAGAAKCSALKEIFDKYFFVAQRGKSPLECRIKGGLYVAKEILYFANDPDLQKEFRPRIDEIEQGFKEQKIVLEQAVIELDSIRTALGVKLLTLGHVVVDQE